VVAPAMSIAESLLLRVVVVMLIHLGDDLLFMVAT
jgi:hypothetical protein